jgi:uncharacterized membrane protein
VEKSPRTLAFIAYLLPLIGPFFILFYSRKNLFAVYHACQSLAIAAGTIMLPLLWLVVSWTISWIPLIGAVLVVSLFAVVMATWLAALITWIMGMVNALQGNYRRVPIFGQWGERAFLRFNADEGMSAPQEGQEAAI